MVQMASIRRSLWAAVGALCLVIVACNGPPGPPGGATVIQAVPALISFPGTTSASIAVTANGTWTASSEQPWVSVSLASGTGNATVTVTVDRTGLSPGHYAASILFRGSTAREVATVYMRFPNVSGNISGPPGSLLPASDSVAALAEGTAEARFEYVPGEVLVSLDPIAVALESRRLEAGPGGELEVGPGGELTAASVGPAAMTQAAQSLAAAYRLSVQAPISVELGAFVLETGGREVMTVVRELRRDGRVRSASPNYLVSHFRVPNDPLFPEQWHYRNIRLTGLPAPAGWDLTTGAIDRVVAVLDTGIDPLHPDLAGRVVEGYDFVLNRVTMSDPHGHGTHVAGTVGAATDNGVGVAGVDWNTRIMPVRVLGADGTGDTANVYRGILFAAGLCVQNSVGVRVCPPRQAQVINLSLGTPNRTDPGRTCRAMPPPTIRAEAVAWALANGSVVVAAAGNDTCPLVSTPAAYPGVIAVAATERTNARAPYSNWGPEIWVSAPGGDMTGGVQTNGVLSTEPGNRYGWQQGTSMASPHVAGVASLMLAVNRDLTPAWVRILLARTATDLGPTGRDLEFGHGLVHAARAVAAARDLLTARNSDFIVRIRSGATVIAETRADPGGNFAFENVPAGSYTIEAGTDVNRNGVLGEPGEFFGSAARVVVYLGDVTGVTLNVTAR